MTNKEITEEPIVITSPEELKEFLNQEAVDGKMVSISVEVTADE
jgi:hypothetical protein